MTADVEMLPELVDEGLDFFNLAGDEGDKLYVRAIRQHIAAQAAEIEALRAEVASAQQMTETVHEAMRVAVANEVKAEARAERLAEALQDAREFVAEMLSDERAKFAGYEAISDIARIEATLQKIDTALAQEARNG